MPDASTIRCRHPRDRRASVCRQPEPSLRARSRQPPPPRSSRQMPTVVVASIASVVSPTALRAPVNDRCTNYGCLASGSTGRIRAPFERDPGTAPVSAVCSARGTQNLERGTQNPEPEPGTWNQEPGTDNSCTMNGCRGVAQPGRALGSGPRGRRFKSSRPDQ